MEFAGFFITVQILTGYGAPPVKVIPFKFFEITQCEHMVEEFNRNVRSDRYTSEGHLIVSEYRTCILLGENRAMEAAKIFTDKREAEIYFQRPIEERVDHAPPSFPQEQIDGAPLGILESLNQLPKS